MNSSLSIVAVILAIWTAHSVWAAPSCTFGKSEPTRIYGNGKIIKKVLFCKKKSGQRYVELVWKDGDRGAQVEIVEQRRIRSTRSARNSDNQKVVIHELSMQEAFVGTRDVQQLVEIPAEKALRVNRKPVTSEILFQE